MFEGRFKDQVAIVTGGAVGLGRVIGERLAREGAHVVLFDMNRENLDKAKSELEAENLSVSVEEVNVADEVSVEAGVAGAMKVAGRLDVMINSAGIVGPTNTKTQDIETSAYHQVLDVNLHGSFYMTKHCLVPMLKRDYGRILLVASIAGKDGNAGMSPYSISKAGVIGLTKATGKEYAETGVTINALAPAVIRTAMVDNCAPEQVEYMTSKIPMKRCGTLDEVAATATWIVSEESSFNTGFTFDLSGGRAVY